MASYLHSLSWGISYWAHNSLSSPHSLAVWCNSQITYSTFQICESIDMMLECWNSSWWLYPMYSQCDSSSLICSSQSHCGATYWADARQIRKHSTPRGIPYPSMPMSSSCSPLRCSNFRPHSLRWVQISISCKSSSNSNQSRYTLASRRTYEIKPISQPWRHGLRNVPRKSRRKWKCGNHSQWPAMKS